MSVYTQTLRLRTEHVNAFRVLRTSELFRLLQEASIRHTEELGMGRHMTLDRGLLWMITLQRARITRMPSYDEDVVLTTWPGETMHLLFPRSYRLETAGGEELLTASALWCLTDKETRRMIFPEKAGIVIPAEKDLPQIPQPQPVRTEVGEEETRFTVPFSYLDLNGHMNNTRYFELAEDILPEASQGLPLREISTEYLSEIRGGEELKIRIGASGPARSLTAEAGGKTRFKMRLVY